MVAFYVLQLKLTGILFVRAEAEESIVRAKI